MARRHAPHARHPAVAALIATIGGALVVASAPVWAQYKVVQPDGTVTYTDRPQSREQIKPPASAPASPQGDASRLSNRNVISAPQGAPASDNAGAPATNDRLPQGVAGRARASELIRTLNSSQPLNNGLSPAQVRAIIIGDASTDDIASGAAARALAKLPAANTAPPPSTLGQDRLRALGANDAWTPQLRATASQRPVVLFTNPACSVCHEWQTALAQQGVPTAVFTVSSPGDFALFQRLTGQSAVPALALGGQVVATAETPWATGLKALEQAGYSAAQAAKTGAGPAPARPLAESPQAANTLMRTGAASLPTFTP